MLETKYTNINQAFTTLSVKLKQVDEQSVAYYSCPTFDLFEFLK